MKTKITVLVAAIIEITVFVWLMGSEACQTPLLNILAVIALMVTPVVAWLIIEPDILREDES